MAGPEYCALGLKFAQLGRLATVGWSAQDRTTEVDFAARLGSRVNARNGVVLEQWPGTCDDQRMESLAEGGIPPAQQRWCRINRLVSEP